MKKQPKYVLLLPMAALIIIGCGLVNSPTEPPGLTSRATSISTYLPDLTDTPPPIIIPSQTPAPQYPQVTPTQIYVVVTIAPEVTATSSLTPLSSKDPSICVRRRSTRRSRTVRLKRLFFVTINEQYKETGWIPGGLSIPFLESRDASQGKTLVCILESQIWVGTYTDNQPGYRLTWDIRLIQVSTGQVLAANSFYGEDPPKPRLPAADRHTACLRSRSPRTG